VKNNETLYNLTFALNDKANVHNLASQQAVYRRLAKHEGDIADLQQELIEIGKDFMKGAAP
jgi:hypothetical protein